MDGQDWNTVVLTNKPKTVNKFVNNSPKPEQDIKIEVPKNLQQLISQGRTTKNLTQKQLSTQLGIAVQVLSRWETGKEIPSNVDISKIEKVLCVKLPRTKKIKLDKNTL